MSRLQTCFSSLKSENRCALIPYITAGDPKPGVTVDIMHALVSAGADVIELGVPFSDPMADGPVIQAACERALKHHTSLTDVLNMVVEFRQSDKDTPIVLMGYANPIECMGYEQFVERAAIAGVDGILTVDLPPEEAGDFMVLLKEKSMDPVFLLSPTSTDERIQKIANAASGFLYYVSLKGVTGAGNLDVDAVAAKLDTIRSMSNLPVGVGFGISDAGSAAKVAKVADAVVVGSALIRILESNQNDIDVARQKITDLLSSMRSSIDIVRFKTG